MKTMKKFLITGSLAACAALNLSAMQETVNGYTWTYRVKNGEAMVISENGGKCSCAVFPDPKGSITIPSSLGGAKVTCVGTNAFIGCKNLSSVIIPEGVSGISPFAFGWCGKLASVAIPSSMKSIDGGAFQGCGGLTTVKIPSNVTHIGPAFFHCSGLTAIHVDADNPSYKSVRGMLLTKDGKTLVRGVKGDVTIPSGVTDIVNGAFFDCGLKSVKIPPSVTNIWQTAFCECGELKSVTIPEGVVHLGLTAFKGCIGLTSVTVPSSVKYVGSELFLDCQALMSVTMRGERPDFGRNVFRNCRKLKAIHVPANAKSWAGMKEWQGIPLVFDGKDTAAASKVDMPTQEKISVAQKLESCDFLLNKDFKKNAKYYLCLFSASWCGPCRREMPRIAKMYAETLKADPNIELVHFSRDQNDEKALSWAKEHDVKFPVVKPKGGNPLNLQSRGIPHLFIVKADGALVEEGHPAKLFCGEKLSELK